MNQQSRAYCLTYLLMMSCSVASPAADQKIELIGIGRLPGTALDMSGATDALENGDPHNRLGGLSALEYTGQNSRFIALSDRGPDDGATGYQCRMHQLDIHVGDDIDGTKFQTIEVRTVSTTLLRDSKGRCFSGSSSDFKSTEHSAGRLDPEGIRLNPAGSVYVSDEYGPQLIEFHPDGRENQRFSLPDHLLVRHPASSKKTENTGNRIGRASNKGMEGLAISKDGTTLTGIMQNVLLQDGERQPDGKPRGVNCRLIQFDIDTGTSAEYVYQLDAPEYGLNEIEMLSDHEFLVIERDGLVGSDAGFKRVIKIDTRNATDVVSLNSLPSAALPASIIPVRKKTFIDLLDPRLRLPVDDVPEKIEGLTFGPRLPDGRQTLFVCSDNDFEANEPTLIYVFAVSELRSSRGQR